MFDAAVLADEYILTHRDTFDKSHWPSERGAPVVKPSVLPVRPNPQGEIKASGKEGFGAKDRPVCFYCKKRGHTMNQCFALNKRNKSSKSS